MYRIRLTKKGHKINAMHVNRNFRLVKREVKINIKSVSRKIFLQKKRQLIRLSHVGGRGPQGIPGPGVPTGGVIGQVLQKESGTDYDTGWVDPSFGDKNFTQEFTVTDIVPVNHNLNKYPAVNVIDSAGDEVLGEVLYSSLNQIILTFASPFSGRITCN